MISLNHQPRVQNMNMTLNMYDGDRETLIGEMPKTRRYSDRRAESNLIADATIINRAWAAKQGLGEMNIYLNWAEEPGSGPQRLNQMMYKYD